MTDLAQRLAGAGIGVKRLEWEYSGKVPAHPWGDSTLQQWRGRHNMGRYAGSYTVQQETSGGFGWWNTWTSDREPEGLCDTLAAAQSAAQADYDARIIAALELKGAGE